MSSKEKTLDLHTVKMINEAVAEFPGTYKERVYAVAVTFFLFSFSLRTASLIVSNTRLTVCSVPVL